LLDSSIVEKIFMQNYYTHSKPQD